MEKISDIRAVAQMAQVSIGTVSNAFKRPEKVAPKTRKRILDIAEQLNYYPNQLASALVTSKTHLLGLMITHSQSGARGIAVNRFAWEATKQGFMVIVVSTDMNFEAEKQAISRFIQYRVDGVVLYSDFGEGHTEHIKMLEDNGIPCVVVKRFHDTYENVIVTAEQALEDLASQLYKYGHHRIGVISLPLLDEKGQKNVRSYRLETFRRYLSKKNITLCEKDIMLVSHDTKAEGEQAVDRWLASGQKIPTAFLCFYDYVAIGVMARLQKRGYIVPEQISVIGYGNYEAGAFCSPQLTSVDIREQDILQTAFEMLSSRIQDPEMPKQNIEIEHQLILRDSFGPCKV